MAYTKLGPFTDGTGPYLSAATLTALDAGIANADKRLSELFFDVTDYGAKGDNATNDTAAVQAAVTAALAATDPINVEHPLYNGRSPVVFFPLGTYLVDTITVPGTVKFAGVGAGIYAASVLAQRTAGQNIVTLTADTDGSSNASVFENMTFKSTSGSSVPTVAQVKTAAGIASNSIYFRSCWFKTPEAYAIWITQGDDIQITGCTFDVAPFNAVRLGTDTTNRVTNATISGNTFYNVALRCLELTSTHGVAVVGNRAYADTLTTTSVFLDASNTAAPIRSTTVGTNEVYRLQTFAKLGTVTAAGVEQVAFTGNSIDGVEGSILTITGGGILYALTFVGNTIESVGAYAAGAAFVATASGLQTSIIAHNAVIAGGTTARMFDMADARVTGNVINGNASLRFTANNNFASPTANGA